MTSTNTAPRKTHIAPAPGLGITHGETRTGSDGVLIAASVPPSGWVLWRDPQGQLHNPDGPAFYGFDGEQMWCHHGPKHRLDGPAHTDQFGVERFFVNGLAHRLDGPAVQGPAGTPWRSKEWFVDGKRHRVDGPAIDAVGGKEWFVDGKRHRLDGPAVEKDDGRREWWVDGKQHRTDGPAVVKANSGGEEWWLDGIRYADVWAWRDAGGTIPETPAAENTPPEVPAKARVGRRKAA